MERKGFKQDMENEKTKKYQQYFLKGCYLHTQAIGKFIRNEKSY